MKSLPKEQGGGEAEEGNTESATLDAIQALLYEGDASGPSCILTYELRADY